MLGGRLRDGTAAAAEAAPGGPADRGESYRRRYVARRGILRAIQATHPATDPATIRISGGPSGKPQLDSRGHADPSGIA
jgi:phosphopantetheinyl transferase